MRFAPLAGELPSWNPGTFYSYGWKEHEMINNTATYDAESYLYWSRRTGRRIRAALAVIYVSLVAGIVVGAAAVLGAL